MSTMPKVRPEINMLKCDIFGIIPLTPQALLLTPSLGQAARYWSPDSYVQGMRDALSSVTIPHPLEVRMGFNGTRISSQRLVGFIVTKTIERVGCGDMDFRDSDRCLSKYLMSEKVYELPFGDQPYVFDIASNVLRALKQPYDRRI